MALGSIPQILWGATYENVLTLGYPLDSVVTGRVPRAGSERTQGVGAVEVGWITGYDYTLEADIRWVPDVPTTNPAATQWGGPVGVEGFLDWARAGNAFRFVPDVTTPLFYVDNCYLVQPFDTGSGNIESDGTHTIHIKYRTPTTSFAQAVRGIMFEYTAGADLTAYGMNALAVTRSTTGTRIGTDLRLATDAINVLRDRNYEGTLRTTLIEQASTNNCPYSESFTNWTKVGTGTLTSAAITLGDLSMDNLNDTDAAGITNWNVAITHPGSGAPRGVAIFVKKGVSPPPSGTVFVLRDETASANRLYATITWSGTVPSVAMTTGTFVRARPCGMALDSAGNPTAGLVYRLEFQTVNLTAVNSHKVYVYPAGITASETGDIYVGGVHVESANYVSSYIKVAGAGTAVRQNDIVQFTWLFGPQAGWSYHKFVELSTTYGASLDIFQVKSTSGYLLLQANSNFYGFYHHNGATQVGSVMGVSPAIGTVVELLCLLYTDGSVELIYSFNGGAAVSAGRSAANLFRATWSSPVLCLGSGSGGNADTGFTALARSVFGAGVAVNTIPLARAA